MKFEEYSRDWLVRQTLSKAECDLPSVASIIGYYKAIDMFRAPEKYDLFERKKSRNVNDYYDELYFGKPDGEEV